ncbi:MAG: glycosyltransferase [Caldilinea sp. CFX5]|nr:glycosyltransferase [Caldilinea sp. CFX5]
MVVQQFFELSDDWLSLPTGYRCLTRRENALRSYDTPTMPSPVLGRAPKILIYSHDTFGLGNIRRTLLLAQAMRDEFADASILLVTGSPVIHSFRIPDRVDYIKLPCLDRVAADTYEPLYLGQHSATIKEMRQDLLHRSILSFAPDLMIVDKRPGGIDNELLPTLETLARQRQRPRLVLGVRDILDEPERTRRSLHNSHSFELIDRYYDEVWVYGVPEIFDHLGEYAYPTHIAAKTYYCGYLRRPVEAAKQKDGAPRVLVTTGGGGDGSAVVEAYLAGLLELPRRVVLRTKVIFGPQMPAADRERLLARYAHLRDVKFRDFKPDLTEEYAKADLVVAMAGYNTVCELLSSGKRAVLVPRAEPVQEQLIRARKLHQLGLFDLVEQSQLTPTRLLTTVLATLARATPGEALVDLDGLPRIRQRVHALLGA